MIWINQIRFVVNSEAPRRSTSSLGDLFALTAPACSETMLA